MRMVRIYQPGCYKPGQSLELSAEASQHVGLVLRMKLQSRLVLFCGDNHEFLAVITAVQKKKVVVYVESMALIDRESPRKIHLAQAISKGERMEFVVQKAVELGVSSITPIVSAHSVVKLDESRQEKKLKQWQAIAVAACEQSGRNTIPMIHPFASFDAFIKNTQAALKFILSPEGRHSWRDYTFDHQEMALLIGPEGGLSEKELQQAQVARFLPLQLGPRILRTETAAITALSVLQAVSGDL